MTRSCDWPIILCLFLLLGDENVQEIYDAIVMVREDQTGGEGGGGGGGGGGYNYVSFL